jgi:hypothetical protein
MVRAAMVLAGSALLLVVHVEGTALYLAWALIVVPVLSEAAAMLVYRQRQREKSRR